MILLGIENVPVMPCGNARIVFKALLHKTLFCEAKVVLAASTVKLVKFIQKSNKT